MRVLLLSILLAISNTTVRLENIFKPVKDDVKHYSRIWKDLDTRPLPQWYDSAKIGIFIHWGVYSVPAFKNEWFWHHWVEGDKEVKSYIKQHYGARFKYKYFARHFTANLFKADEWAKLFAKSGARYVVITAKHHDGFSLFPTKRVNWNSVNVGPKKDILNVLSKAIRKHNMKFGVYYSLFEWYNKLYLNDKRLQFKNSSYTNKIVWPDIQFMIDNYKPSVLWLDGESEADASYWNTPEILAWLYNKSPVKDEIVVNDRLGSGTHCRHGDIYNCGDSYNPRILMQHKWENAFPLDKQSWGYRRDMELPDVYSFDEMLENIVSTVSCGGNVLINIGPTDEGIIVPLFKKRLLQMGRWLEKNGEAIYDSSPWFHQRDVHNADVWYTCVKQPYHQFKPTATPYLLDTVKAIYVIFLKWPRNDVLRLKGATSILTRQNCTIELIQRNGYIPVKHRISNDMVTIDLFMIIKKTHKQIPLYSGVLKISSSSGNLKNKYM